jgi:DnaJ-domain-containing protein 1
LAALVEAQGRLDVAMRSRDESQRHPARLERYHTAIRLAREELAEHDVKFAPPSPEALAKAAARALLGVGEGATVAEITRAYRALVSASHPDRNASPDASAETAALNAAYELLTKGRDQND